MSAQMTYNKLELLKLMFLSREGDRREGILLRQSKGWFQVPAMGHEAMGVIPSLLRADDYIFPYYRDRALLLARGLTNKDLANAFFGLPESSSGGKQMPSHYSGREFNIWSVPTPVGTNMLPACGLAWGLQMDGKDSVVLATSGEAATRQGEFYEAVCFAVERQLPVLFVVEDNQYAISTNTENLNPFKLKIFNEEIGVVHVNARHPDHVHSAFSQAITKVRAGEGPVILHCEMDRICSHTSSDDHRVYRDAAEIAEMMTRDPIDVVAKELIEEGDLTTDAWELIQQQIREQVDREYREAENSPNVNPDDLMNDIFAPELVAETPPLKANRKWRIVDAVNQVFKAGLEKDDRYIFFGEDIEDPKGGVFGLTSGLSSAHPDRVSNSPLAEATIAGLALGLACYGKRPVFEMQFIDFVGPAWTQLAQNISTIRWRTGGTWTCPAVIYAPCGAYLPGGAIWHSQTNESQFAHMPGLRVVMPTTPEDAAGLMWTAMHADDPTLVLIPKHRFRQQLDVADVEPVPFGKAALRQEGDDVTVVSWGNCMEIVYDAAHQLQDEVSMEILDLRSIVPWDKEAVRNSLEKTGRLVIVHEDGESCSVGQMIISEMTNDPESWNNFLSPPQLVAKADVHIGFNPIFEYAALPDTARVIDAIRLTMDE